MISPPSSESSRSHSPDAPSSHDEPTQLVSGAPVERVSPLGYEVTLLSATGVSISQLIGVGIFSTPGTILTSVGSIGLLLTFWIIGPIFAFSGWAMMSELASQFPNRSGGEVVFLEQAYPRPQFLVPTMFAVTSILLSFSVTNSVVFAQYMMHALDITSTPFMIRLFAIGVTTFAIAGLTSVSHFATNLSFTSLCNLNQVVFEACQRVYLHQVASLLFISISGLFVLAGWAPTRHPVSNFSDIWKGSNTNPNSLAMALVKIHFTFTGYANANTLIAEVRSKDPARTIRYAGIISLLTVSVLSFLSNIAYVAAVPKDDIKNSGQLVAALYFENVFGGAVAKKLLPLLIASSCVGNIIAVTIGQARTLREVARQGIIPYPSFFASTRPFGTALNAMIVKYFMTVFVLVVLPTGDAFNFAVNLVSYPFLLFSAATVIGIRLIRRARREQGLAPPPWKAWNAALVLLFVNALFLIFMPWVPPTKGTEDVSFFYATYCIVGLCILAGSALWYYIWMVYLPRKNGYVIMEEVVQLPGGGLTKSLIRKYINFDDTADTAPLLSDQSSHSYSGRE